MEQAEQAGRPYGVTDNGKESRRQHTGTSLLGTLTQVSKLRTVLLYFHCLLLALVGVKQVGKVVPYLSDRHTALAKQTREWLRIQGLRAPPSTLMMFWLRQHGTQNKSS